MSAKYLIFAVSLLAGLIPSPGNAEDCTLKRVASVDMTETPGGGFTVPVSANGSPRKFVVNIDEAFSYVWPPLSTELQPTRKAFPERITVHALGETVRHTVYSDFTLDKVSGSKAEFMELMQSHSPDPAIVGLLGLNLLSLFDVELNFTASKMNLFSQDHCAGKVVYWASSYATLPMTRQPTGLIMVPMTLDGKDVTVGLESDTTQSFMMLSAASRLFGITETSPGVTPSGDSNLLRYTFKRLIAGGLDIENPDIVIYKDNPVAANCNGQARFTDYGKTVTRCYGSVDVRLGMKELRRLHPYFAFKEMVLYLTSIEAH
jgi:hypothetical protein